MNFNLLAAQAQTTANAGSQSIILIIYIVVIIAALYFFMIRPNKKKQKKEDEMRNSIEVGNEILTIGGIFGKVVAVKEDSFIVESGPERSKIRIAKWAIQQNFSAKEAEPKETIKAKKEKKDKKNRGEE
ncbi:MAG: preprotein translocase subunit YajC [Acutalibacteraceae bacterium]